MIKLKSLLSDKYILSEQCAPTDADDEIHVIDYTRGYKQISGIQRIPIAKNVDPKTKEVQIVTSLEDIKEKGLMIKGKPYMSTNDMNKLFSDTIIIEEKVDGHPVIIIYGGYTFFCESLSIRHTVKYDNCPYSQKGWPDMVVVYEILDGEYKPPYSKGQYKNKWLSRKEKESLCSMVGAPIVPLIYSGKITPEKLPKIADRISGFGKEKAEGIVVKNLKKGIFGKFINIEFQKRISDEDLMGKKHPIQLGIKNIRKYR